MKKNISNTSLNKLNNIVSICNTTIKDNFFLNTYHNINIINRGGFGIVLNAYNKISNNRFAIKIVPFLINKDNPNELISYKINNKLKEVRCLSKFNHKNIVNFYDSWIETTNKLPDILSNCNNLNEYIHDLNKDEFLSYSLEKQDILNTNKNSLVILNIFIVMELMDMSLKKYIEIYPLNNRETTKIITSIIDGITYLHSINIVHLDLKPENILIKMVNDTIIDIKIADFGLVIKKDDNLINFNYGTKIYRPPHYDIICFKYDIYSLGIILFELYTEFNTNMERIKCIEQFKSKNTKKYTFLYPLISSNVNDRPFIYEVYKHINLF